MLKLKLQYCGHPMWRANSPEKTLTLGKTEGRRRRGRQRMRWLDSNTDSLDINVSKLQEIVQGFPDSSVGKESACNEGDPRSIPGSGWSPGEGKGYPLQYFGLENSKNCIVHGVAKRWTWLSDFHFHAHFREIVEDRDWHALVHGVTKSWTWLRDWTTISIKTIKGKYLSNTGGTQIWRKSCRCIQMTKVWETVI